VNVLYTGITSLLTGTPAHAYYVAIGGRQYLRKAPQGATFPYVVYFTVSGIADRSFGEMEEETLIQFNIFSKKNSASEAGTILAALFTRYDYCALTVAGYNFISMQRDFVVPNDDFSQDTPIYGYSVQYTTIIQKNR
jgi:hypothetical protein